MAVPEGATKLGTVGIAYKGVYNELQTYKYANAVYYNGSTYIALIDNPAGFPSNDGVNWRYLAQGFLQQAISALTVIDESGILGEVDAEVNAQEFLSKIAELEQGLEDTKANKADTLDTLEEIAANTQSGKVAGALAVKELNSNLKPIDSVPTSGYTLIDDGSFLDRDIQHIKCRISHPIVKTSAYLHIGTLPHQVKKTCYTTAILLNGSNVYPLIIKLQGTTISMFNSIAIQALDNGTQVESWIDCEYLISG